MVEKYLTILFFFYNAKYSILYSSVIIIADRVELLLPFQDVFIFFMELVLIVFIPDMFLSCQKL